MSKLRDMALLACCGAVVCGLWQWNHALGLVGGGVIGFLLLVAVEKDRLRRKD